MAPIPTTAAPASITAAPVAVRKAVEPRSLRVSTVSPLCSRKVRTAAVRRRSRRRMFQIRSSANSPRTSQSGAGAIAEPNAIPATSTTTGGIPASSGRDERRAVVVVIVLASSTRMKAGTRSAWYEPTGTEMVTSCFHDNQVPWTRSTKPCGVGSSPPAVASPGTAS